MARTRTLHGKRVGWSVKLSEPMSDAADALRGDTPRAVWLTEVIAAALGDDPAREAAAERSAAPEPRAAPPAPSLDPVAALRAQMEGFGVPLTTASEMAASPEPEKRPCRHPSASVIDGVCRECGEEVW